MSEINGFGNDDFHQRMKAVAAAAGGGIHDLANTLINRCESLTESERRQYDAPMLIGKQIIDGQLANHPGIDRSAACKSLVAAASLCLAKTFEKHALPKSVLACMPGAMARLAATVTNPIEKKYTEDSDLYRKDLRMVVGHAVPAGAQDVDLFAAVPWTTIIKNPSFDKISRYISAGGTGTWFRIHTDPRDTSEFTESGWHRCYQRIAELLLSRPLIKGMVGTSWFYDPQLLTISPRLAYLQRDPVDGGAFMLRNGPGEIHTQRATLTSPSRRQLFEAGKYLPTCWTVVWPREQLLQWSTTHIAEEKK